jgi:hypothetical protein
VRGRQRAYAQLRGSAFADAVPGESVHGEDPWCGSPGPRRGLIPALTTRPQPPPTPPRPSRAGGRRG